MRCNYRFITLMLSLSFIHSFIYSLILRRKNFCTVIQRTWRIIRTSSFAFFAVFRFRYSRRRVSEWCNSVQLKVIDCKNMFHFSACKITVDKFINQKTFWMAKNEREFFSHSIMIVSDLNESFFSIRVYFLVF